MIIQGIGRKQSATAWPYSGNHFFSAGILDAHTARRRRSLSASLAAEVPRWGSKSQMGTRRKSRRQTRTGMFDVLLQCLRRYWNE
jgi:hypothetical protein